MAKDRSRLSQRDVTELGTVGGWQYVTFDGREFLLDQEALEAGLVSRPIGPGEIRIAAQRERLNFGTVEQFTETIRGLAVPTGTYAAAAAKAAQASARTEKARELRPVDTLKDLAFLQGRSDRVVAVSLVPGRTPGPDRIGAIIERLASKHITLSLTTSGKLIVVAPSGRVMADAAQAIQAASRLLIGRLGGAPVLCEVDGCACKGKAPATTILMVDVASCAAGSEAN
jgi:hypothetical protein